MEKSDLEKERDEFIRQNAKVLYKRVSEEFGQGANEKNSDKRHGISGIFTNVKFK